MYTCTTRILTAPSETYCEQASLCGPSSKHTPLPNLVHIAYLNVHVHTCTHSYPHHTFINVLWVGVTPQAFIKTYILTNIVYIAHLNVHLHALKSSRHLITYKLTMGKCLYAGPNKAYNIAKLVYSAHFSKNMHTFIPSQHLCGHTDQPSTSAWRHWRIWGSIQPPGVCPRCSRYGHALHLYVLMWVIFGLLHTNKRSSPSNPLPTPRQIGPIPLNWTYLLNHFFNSHIYKEAGSGWLAIWQPGIQLWCESEGVRVCHEIENAPAKIACKWMFPATFSQAVDWPHLHLILLLW